MNNHQKFMSLALEEAKKGYGLARPNPMVGAVLVKDNKVLAKGFHQYFGGNHAERDLLNKIDAPQGATLYCTLEPCCHLDKKTPPCAPLIIEKRISEIVIAMRDPNPKVSGKGISQLQDSGINVIEGVLEKEAREINRSFITNMKEGRCYVHLKIAQTKNGKLVLPNQKWITGLEAREEVHWERANCDAILVGGETFRKDSPQLNVRDIPLVDHPKFRQPHRFIASRKEKNITGFQSLVVENWQNFFNSLYREEKIGSLYIEAGPNLASELISQSLYDQLSVFVAPFESTEGVGVSETEKILRGLNPRKEFANGDQLYTIDSPHSLKLAGLDS